MNRLVRRGSLFAKQVTTDPRAAVADIGRWMWSSTEACGLRFTRGDVADPPPAKVPLHARPLDDSIASRVFDLDDLSSDDQIYLDRRRAIYEAGFRGGWLAVDDDDNPAYLQWLIPPSDADKISDFFGPLFPDQPDTLVVEGAWIPPDFRKQKVMGQGLALVTEAALASNPETITATQCYPAADNRGAVLGTRSAGYTVNELRTETWRLGRCTVDFRPATEADFTAFQPRD